MSWRTRLPCSSRKGWRGCEGWERQIQPSAGSDSSSRALTADAAAAPGGPGTVSHLPPSHPGQPGLTPSLPPPPLPPLDESPKLRPKTGFFRERCSEPRGTSAALPPPAVRRARGWSGHPGGSAPVAGCATGVGSADGAVNPGRRVGTAGSGVSRSRPAASARQRSGVRTAPEEAGGAERGSPARPLTPAAGLRQQPAARAGRADRGRRAAAAHPAAGGL